MKSWKLSDDDIARAKTMRKNGDSFQKIVDSLGVSRQWIWVIIHRDGNVPYQQKLLNRVIFPAIRNYLHKNRISITQFSVLCNVSYRTMYQRITGQTDILKRTIDQILRVTGMTYEEAFKEDEKE